MNVVGGVIEYMRNIALSTTVTLRVPVERFTANAPLIDVRGALGAIRLVPGLFAFILFSTFNNLIGGVYMALMDPYGLELFPVELWGVVFAVASTGFIIGGLVVARFGLGRNPIRTLLILSGSRGCSTRSASGCT